MIGRLFRAAAWVFVYTCVATVLAQAILLGYARSRWGLDHDKLMRMLAVAYSIDLDAIRSQVTEEELPPTSEQVSYDQILAARAVKAQHLELRELALQQSLGQLQFESQQLAQQSDKYQQLKKTFEAQLLALQQQAQSSGIEDNLAKLEALKPAQAKQLLVEMLEKDEIDDVVILLKNMNTSKAAKIIGEFKTPQELEQIAEVLRRIRQGEPAGSLASSTAEQLAPGTSGGQ